MKIYIHSNWRLVIVSKSPFDSTMDLVRQAIKCVTKCFNCKEDAVHQVEYFTKTKGIKPTTNWSEAWFILQSHPPTSFRVNGVCIELIIECFPIYLLCHFETIRLWKTNGERFAQTHVSCRAKIRTGERPSIAKHVWRWLINQRFFVWTLAWLSLTHCLLWRLGMQ